MLSVKGERYFSPLLGLGLCTQEESKTSPKPLSSHQGTYWREMTDFYIHPFYEFFHKAGRMGNMTGLVLVVIRLFPVEME